MADLSSSAALRPLAASARVRREHAAIERQSSIMHALLAGSEPELTARAAKVSAWSVGQQLDHMLRVDRAVLKTLRQVLDHLAGAPVPPAAAAALTAAAAASAGTGPTFVGRVVLWSGYMPRGVGKAAANLRPDEDPLAAARAAARQMPEIDGRLAALAPRLAEVDAAARAGHRLPHPRLGSFDAVEWLRFLYIHRHHHLKVVRDIRRRAGLRPDLPRA
jgi:hypothetical protein